MSTHLVCPICGKQFECDEPHEGPHDVLTTVKPCPQVKGAIYVYVLDNRQEGASGVKTHCGTQAATTDPQGFAGFEQLEAGPYATRIALDESDDEVQAKYYVVTRTATKPTVEPGKITLVEFVVNRHADLRVKLAWAEGDGELPRARVAVDGPCDEPERTVEGGKAEFKRLRPTETYKVACALHDDDARDFALEQAERTGVTVTATRTTELVFRVARRHWVDLALVDAEDGALKGSVKLVQGDADLAVGDVGGEATHVADLKPGTVDIDGVTLPESREFVALR